MQGKIESLAEVAKSLKNENISLASHLLWGWCGGKMIMSECSIQQNDRKACKGDWCSSQESIISFVDKVNVVAWIFSKGQSYSALLFIFYLYCLQFDGWVVMWHLLNLLPYFVMLFKLMSQSC